MRSTLPTLVLILLAAALGATGCSRASVWGPRPGVDDGGSDAGLDAGPDAGERDGGQGDGGTDGGQLGDCAGESSVTYGRGFVRPLPVTTSLQILNCCDAASLHLHAEPLFGAIPTMMVRAWGGWSEGEFELGAEDSPYELNVTMENGQVFAPVTGTLRLDREPAGDWSAPVEISLCGAFELDGERARVWIDRARVASWDGLSRFELRLLADPSIAAVDAAARPLDALALKRDPLLNLGSIAWYAWGEQALFGEGGQTPSEVARQLPPIEVGGLPFVVIADGQRIYLGAFWTEASSLVFRGPTITWERLHGPAFFLEAGEAGGLDPRADPRIRAVLEETGKLAP